MRRHIMSMLAPLAAAGLLLTGGPSAAAATAPPAEFGTDWHDPVTAAPPVDRPSGRSCTVTLAEAQFRNFTPYKGTYTPPADCGSDWSKVVLRMDGKVKGRQYDRLGYLTVGGVEVFKTSTPEPSADGIEWSVEKDVTRYAATFAGPQPVEMLIGNVVNETYTGVLDVKVTLTFYAGQKADAPDRVLTLAGARNEGTTYSGDLTTPRNSERIVAEVYATGSGGGCEEFWYTTVPDAHPYSCKASDGPYREVQIRVDGELAGIAAPYPHIYTGGWSNPFLWYVIPAPRAFDIQPVRYDLTPFAGLLNDGRPHRVEVSVLGVPQGQSGWSLPTNVLVWQDAGSSVVTGGLTAHRTAQPEVSDEFTSGDPELTLEAKGSHALTVSGYVDTSHGRVSTTVDRTLWNASDHTWTEGENYDELSALWRDTEKVTVAAGGRTTVTSTARTYSMDGTITVDSADRLRTVMELADRAATSVVRDGVTVSSSRLDDTYDGDASWTLGVPREERHAVGTSREHYRLTGTDGCYDRVVATVQGFLTEDRAGC
ncbi:peptide-N4-asparagine amidase [Streptomyces sp. NPDC051940]|uniref:peptide-N4-asparagine amidase n=1 Tax=Streptomyces sp. NPDC051940 TaxID=3155675 RepID=UPI0034465F24